MSRRVALDRRCHDAALMLALAGFATLAWSLFGLDGWLYRDDAVYLYGGQRLLDGVMPYLSIFDHKTPLATLLCAAGSGLSRLAGLDDVIGARLLYALLCILSVPALYALVLSISRSRLAAALAALTLIAAWSYGRQAVSGPNAKTPYVFFEIVFLLAATRRWWFISGLAAALATWTWQPGIGFLAVGALLLRKGSPGAQEQQQDFSPLLRFAGGVALPTILLAGWFILAGAFYALLEGSTLFNLLYLRREEVWLGERLWRPLRVAWLTNGWVGPWLTLGLGSIALQLGYRLRQEGLGSRWAALGLTLPFCLLFALLDFQGAADFYPLLPFAAAGLGMGIASAVERVPAARPRLAVAAGLFVAAICGTIQLYHSRHERGLLDQRAFLREVEQTYGADTPLATIGLPEVLVLAQEPNLSRYSFVINGIDNLIAAREENGFPGWVADLERAAPPLIAWGDTELSPEREALLQEWLREHYAKRAFGYWTIYERLPTAD